ncbi:MAG TPA: hypothetical protein PKY25_00385 [Bacilli bacterium]|nr:hypothetical protein [Bacilli bacterium]
MITLINKNNIRLGILENDINLYKEILLIAPDSINKKTMFEEIEQGKVPEYYKNKVVVILLSSTSLIGYIVFEIKNSVDTLVSNYINIVDININTEFDKNQMKILLHESVIYIGNEIGIKKIEVLCNKENEEEKNFYKTFGFHEYGNIENKNILSASVQSLAIQRKVLSKFRQIDPSALEYKDLVITKKISTGKSSDLYLTSNNEALKMFTSTSFTFLKDREETLKELLKLDVKEVIKPKQLVYFEGSFTGYTMEYLPVGESIVKLKDNKYSFEEKIEIIKKIEDAMKKLHSKNIYICDLNPDNIFVDDKSEIRFIDCDSFVIKEHVLNNKINIQYRDPQNEYVSKETDIYAFALTILQILTGINIDEKMTREELILGYEKSKPNLPISIKTYYDKILKENQRLYLSDAYEKYVEELYKPNEIEKEKQGKAGIILLSVITIITGIIVMLLILK